MPKGRVETLIYVGSMSTQKPLGSLHPLLPTPSGARMRVLKMLAFAPQAQAEPLLVPMRRCSAGISRKGNYSAGGKITIAAQR